jgi:dihydroorotate dehydrogenase
MLTIQGAIFAAMYRLIRKFLFLIDAEKAHYIAMNAFRMLCAVPVIRRKVQNIFSIKNEATRLALFGIHFKNHVGLGAGFDKNARYLRELEALGFGFVEIGTVTPRPQAGNDRPRLFRLPKDHALINRMGFNNDGVEAVAARLKTWRESQQANDEIHNKGRFIIGGNIGKNKSTPNEEAWKDYETCFRVLHPFVDFFVVNVSSPNTPGLRALQEKDALKKILVHLQQLNNSFPQPKPILLKIAPDLTPEQIDDVIDLSVEIQLDGLVATNTTIRRDGLRTPAAELQRIGAGGLSGKPVMQQSTDVVRYIHTKTKGRLPVIGSGGIFTSRDAQEKMQAGAVMVEVWTGFIYEGPFIVKRICSVLNS